MWKRSDFEFKELLGEGTQTQVFRAIDRASGKQVAIKIIRRQLVIDMKIDHAFRREIEIQYHLQSTN